MTSDNDLGINIQEFAPHSEPRSSRANSAQGMRWANNALALFLLGVVAFSPIPLASNRPAFWAISATFIALAGVAYVGFLWRINADTFRFSLRAIKFPVLLFCAFIGFLIVQILPTNWSKIDDLANGGILFKTISTVPGATILMILRQLGYGLFFFLVLQVGVNPKRARKVLLAIFAIVAAHALFGLLALTQFGDLALIGEKARASIGSATGVFVNRNSFATFLGIGAICGISLIWQAGQFNRSQIFGRTTNIGQNIWRFFGLLAFILIVSTLAATKSRMGVFSTICGVAVCCALIFFRSWGTTLGRTTNKLIAVLAICAGFIVALLVVLFFGEGLLERLGSVDNDFDVRSALYRQIFGMIVQRPWTGFGGGSFELTFPLFHEFPVSADLIWDKTHSSFLTLWVELGIFAGTLPMIILVLFVFSLLKLLALHPQRAVNTLAALGATALVALHSTLDFSLEIQANAYLYLAVLGLGVAGLANPVRAKSHSEATRQQ